MMPLKGMIIKHKYFMDVALYIRAPVLTFKKGSFLLRCEWINQGFVDSYKIGIRKKLSLSNTELIENWLYCEEPNAKCIRHVKWSPFR